MENNKNNNNIISLEKEIKKSYLDYAMSVIISRALPDVRDGLKPVHRRILYAMSILKNDYNKDYKKSARIVGDVIGKYHPHGDNSVYDAIVRMAQFFSLRYPLIDGQGNFGSIDGDPAAAMRYTEIRMSKISHELLQDIDKNTVNFNMNYDNTEEIPEVLPTRIPNLLINGSYGIAVGVATNIPPHNINEIIDGCIAIIKNKNISVKDLIKYIPGPDFPTGGIICNKNDIENIYRTGKGKISIKSKIDIEINKNTGDKFIIIKEIPYQINKIKLIEKIIDCIKQKKIIGINNIIDESSQEGIRIVIDIKKDFSEENILNNLYINTQLQNNLYINMIALCNKKPKLMSLKDILLEFIKHRENIIYRKNLFLFNKYNKKINIIEGFIITIYNINNIIDIIKESNSLEETKNKLKNIEFKILENFKININKYYNIISKNIINNNIYKFNDEQIKSILDLKLYKLTKLENELLINEYNLLINNIKECISILNNKNSLENSIYKELLEIKNLYKDKRLTKIIDDKLYTENKNILTKEFKVIITISYYGYIKYQPLSHYNIQKRGGKGKSSTKIKSEDFIKSLLISDINKDILLFSNIGKMYKMKIFQLPESSKYSKGKPIYNLININKNERITSIISIDSEKINNNNYFLMSTSMGFVKKTLVKELIKSRNSGIIVIKLYKNDELIDINITNGNNDIMLFSENGKSVRFKENNVRLTKRNSYGIKGICLNKNDRIVSLIISENNNNQILTITKNGFGKRTEKIEFPVKSRATQGVISTKITNKTGKIIKSIEVNNNDQILIITDTGTIVRLKVNEIRISKRNTLGVKLIKISKTETVVDIKRFN
ncbi:DNA gyrase subunit A [endosymbiont of Euscepes postfasciatus]|uniref:DNA gyrase subunit A n=1 Tax=endosymbiont of Euscepes postfasciatus TaxID=650377 RepID=UPI000DC72132|nr:DNA gyrase subunit A [endosymbiont of Euscepes postfasciatus]BBA84720.1 DNA gyrase subunit A [endosymbiont of Euscepes postfasciatus]